MYIHRSLVLKVILILVVLTPVARFAFAESTTLSLSESRVQPGRSFIISLEASPDDNVTLTLIGSRGQVMNYVLIVPSSGLIRTDIIVPTTALPDLYTLFFQQKNMTIANGSIIISSMMRGEVLQNMLGSLDGLKNRLEVCLAERKAAGQETPSEVLKEYESALRHLNQARLEWNNGQLRDAEEQLNMAQGEFHAAYKFILNPVKPQEDKDIRVRTSLLRAASEIKKMNSTLRGFNQIGIDTSSLKASILQIQRYVEDANEALKANETTKAEMIAEEALKEMTRIQENAPLRIRMVKIKLAEKYLDKVESRVQNLIQTVTVYPLRLRPAERVRIIESLQRTEQEITSIKSNLQLGIFDFEAIQGLSSEIKSSINIVQDTSTRLRLTQIDELKSQILALSTMAESQEGSPYQQLLNEIQSKTSQMENLKQQLQTAAGSSDTGAQGSEGGANKPSTESTTQGAQKPNITG